MWILSFVLCHTQIRERVLARCLLLSVVRFYTFIAIAIAAAAAASGGGFFSIVYFVIFRYFFSFFPSSFWFRVFFFPFILLSVFCLFVWLGVLMFLIIFASLVIFS